MNTQDLLDKLYGVNTFDADDQMGITTINTTPTQFLANDPNALQLTIINTGTNDMNIWTDSTVSTTKGIRIAANGGSYEIDFTRFGTFPTRTWWAIGLLGSTTLNSKRLLSV